jgi:hypothetical protein
MNKLNSQDIAVAEYLKSIGIPFNSGYLGTKQDDTWNADSFIVNFQNEKFEFNTGFGHRLKLAGFNKLSVKDMAFVKELREVVYNTSDKVTTKLSDNSVVVKPTSASVLYCLLMDAQALDTSFKYWCDDYGYDTDSLKSLGIYTSCCDTGEKINKVFNPEQRLRLRELLEDY